MKIKRNNIIVAHEYGAKGHYKALNELDSNIEFYELNILKQLIKSLLGKGSFRKTLKNLIFIVEGFLSKKTGDIIIGLAPYDFRILLFLIVYRRKTIHLHTSYPCWNSSHFPKGIKFNKRIWEIFFKKCSTIFCVTAVSAESINLAYPHLKLNTEVVYHSLKMDEVKIKKNISNNIIFIGRLVPEKGIDIIIDLSLRLNHFKFHIVGDGPLFNYLKKKVKSNVKLYGHINDKILLNNIIDKCSFSILPSLRKDKWIEAFGMTIIETMSRGLIPICTDHPGPSEILTDECGFVLDEKSYLRKTIEILKNIDELDFINKSKKCAERARFFFSKNISKKWRRHLK